MVYLLEKQANVPIKIENHINYSLDPNEPMVF